MDSYLTRAKLHAEAPKAFPYAGSWFTGDNIEMAFGQGETVLTPIEQAVAYSTFANGGTRYAPQVASAGRRPADGQGRQEDRAAGDRAGGDLAGQLQRHAAGVRGRHLEPARHGVQDFQGFPASWNLAGKTGTASNQAGLEPNSWFVAFGPNPNPTVPRAGRHRPGWLRRPGRRPAGAQHLRLHRGQPRDRTAPVKTPDAGQPGQPDRARRPTPPLGTPTTTTTTTPTGHAGRAEHDDLHHDGRGLSVP